MSHLLTQAEADDLFEFLDEGATEVFELAPARDGKPAKVAKIRGASAAEYVKYVVRRVPAVEALYVAQIRVGIAQAKEAAAAKEAASKQPEEVPFGTRRPRKAAKAEAPAPVAGPEVEDEEKDDEITAAMVATAKANIADGGIEERAALTAVCVGRPGDEALERKIIAHPRFAALSARCAYKTRGADPLAFRPRCRA